METAAQGTVGDGPGSPDPARPAEPAPPAQVDPPADPARPVDQDPVAHDRHEVVLYGSADELARLLAPRVRAAISAGDVVVAVLAAAEASGLRAVLGADADQVEFPDPVQVHAVPAFTVAIRFARAGRRAERAGGSALVIAQHVDGLADRGPEHWARLDIALNVALNGVPVTVLCPYAETDPQLPCARTTHPVITTAAGPAASADYRAPHDAVLDFPPPPPPELGPPTVELAFGAGDLVELRQLVRRIADGAGLDLDRVADLVLATSELASNSIEHGGGSGRLRMWETGAGLLAEVTDHGGHMRMPFPGLVLPPPEGARGRGLWLASELCDVLQVWTEDTATIIRLRTDR